jgi:predicted esterase
MILLALLVLQPVDAVRDYLKSGGEVPKGEIAVIERAVRAAMLPPGPKETGFIAKHEVVSDADPAVTIAYHIGIPADAKAEPLPLLLTLHAQGGDAKEWIDMRLTELKGRAIYVLAPQAGRGGWGHSRLGYSHALGPLRDAIARYPIDVDRVWIDGVSMGANGAWQIASLFPDRFAAIAPRGGAPHFKIVQRGDAKETHLFYARNLRALPVAWTVGAKDPGLPIASVRDIKTILGGWSYDVAYKELPEGGHEWFAEETPRIMDWLATKTRVADPLEVRWTSWETIFNRAYWVEVLDVTGASKVDLPVKDFEGNLIEKRMGLNQEMRLTAIAKRGQNRIDIDGDGVKELRLWLNDRLVDFSKPVRVTWNDRKVFEGKLEPSVKTLLDEVKRRGDPSFCYPAQVTVKVSR